MADDTIRIKDLTTVKPEPDRGDVLVTDGSKTMGLESDYLCNLEYNFGSRFSEDASYEKDEIVVRNGERWKFIVHHEPGPFNVNEVRHANLASPNGIFVVEYGETPAGFKIASAIDSGYIVFVANVPVVGYTADGIIECVFTNIKDGKIYFVGFAGDNVVEVVLGASGSQEQWSFSTSPKTQIFQAVYGTTTWAEILAAADSGARWVRLAYSEVVSEGNKSVAAYASINTVGGTEACFSAAVGEDIWNFYINKTTNAWRYEKIGVIPKVQSATAGKFAVLNADGSIAGSALGPSDVPVIGTEVV